MISPPFDLYHVSHSHQRGTVPDHMSKEDFAAELKAVKEGNFQGELQGIQATDLQRDGSAIEVPRSGGARALPPVQVQRKPVPVRPKRSDELLEETAAAQAAGKSGPRHVQPAEALAFEMNPNIMPYSNIPAVPTTLTPRCYSRGPATQSHALKPFNVPSGLPYSTRPSELYSSNVVAPASPPRDQFSMNSLAAPNTYQLLSSSAPQLLPPTHMPSPRYGKELGGIPEEPEEGLMRSRRTSELLAQEYMTLLHPLSMPSPSDTNNPSFEVQLQQSSPYRPSLRRSDSTASETLGGVQRHRRLPCRRLSQAQTPVLGLQDQRARRSRSSSHIDSLELASGALFHESDWEDEVDYCYDHHMEAHCDLDWNNVSRLESDSSDEESVPELNSSQPSVNSVSSLSEAMLPAAPTYSSTRKRHAWKRERSSSVNSSDDELDTRRGQRGASRKPRPIMTVDNDDDYSGPSTPDLERKSAGTSSIDASEAMTPNSGSRKAFDFPERHESMIHQIFAESTVNDENYLDLESPSLLLPQEFTKEMTRSQMYDELPTLYGRQDYQSPGIHTFSQSGPDVPVENLDESFHNSLLLPHPSNPGHKRKSASMSRLEDFPLPGNAAGLAFMPEPKEQPDFESTEEPERLPSTSRRASKKETLRVNTIIAQLRAQLESHFSPPSTPPPDAISCAAPDHSVKAPPPPCEKDDGYSSAPPATTAFACKAKPLLSPLQSGEDCQNPPLSAPLAQRPFQASASFLASDSNRTRQSSLPPFYRKISSETAASQNIIPSENNYLTTSTTAHGSNKSLPPVPVPPPLRPRNMMRSASVTNTRTLGPNRASFNLFPSVQS